MQLLLLLRVIVSEHGIYTGHWFDAVGQLEARSGRRRIRHQYAIAGTRYGHTVLINAHTLLGARRLIVRAH